MAIASANAQQDPAKALERAAVANPGEKVFAHLSQHTLITGELLWFSVFVTDAQQHKASRLSSVVYAELVGPANKTVIRDKILIRDGAGFGSFYLPATLPTGNYIFRAYTSWMKNAGPEFFFHQEISVVNTLRSPESVSATNTSSSLKIEFFPEGGYLVNGLKSRVAFQVKNAFGRGEDANGYLLKGLDTVASLKTRKFGLGDFYFTPDNQSNYRIVIQDKNGRNIPATLPEIKETGLVMEVKNTSATYRVNIQGSKFNNDNAYRLIVHSRSILKLDKSIRFRDGVAALEFGKDIISDGISHLTLFDSDGRPVLERLVFNQPEKSAFEINPGQAVYNVRTKAIVNWSGLPDSLSRLSVSVYQADSLDRNDDIISWLYLSSDLKGEIESPGYYFSDSSESIEMLDILMLTHGWRRFSWEELLLSKHADPIFLPELKSHLITARIVDMEGKAVAGKTAYLSSPGKVIRLYTAMSDEKGRLFFEVKPDQLGGKLIIQPDRADSLLRIEPEDAFSELFRAWTPATVNLVNRFASPLAQRSIDMQVQDIFREQETFFSTPLPSRDSTAFYGKPDESYLLDDYIRFPALEEVMREFVKGVWVRKRNDKFRLMVLDKDANRMFDQSPVLLLDGVPVRDVDKLFEVDALKIKKIDVMTRKYFTGPLVTQGLISLSSYAGDMAGLTPESGSATIDLTALEEKRIFHAPAYTSIASRESRLPDRRRLLFFDHSVSAKSLSGKFEFFTSDVEGKFLVVINGITASGIPVSAQTWFRVSR